MNKRSENTFIRSNSHPHLLITNGEVIPKDIALPFEFIMEIEINESEEEEQEQLSYEIPNMMSYVRNCSLMHKDMVAVLKSAGVGNIQTFPASVRHPETEFSYHDYLVVNILDLVACADLQKSQTDPLGPSYYFHKLKIDESKVGGLLLFRLAEYSFEIIVHPKVAKALIDCNFNGLLIESLDT